MNRYAEQWQVASDSNPNKFYMVSLTNTGGYECSCPAWTRTTPRRDCKHIRRLQRDNFRTPPPTAASVATPVVRAAPSPVVVSVAKTPLPAVEQADVLTRRAVRPVKW